MDLQIRLATSTDSIKKTTKVEVANCRLLYLIGQLGPGGSERQLLYLLENMDRRRYSPEVVVWSYEKDVPHVSRLRDLGVPLHPISATLSRITKLMALRQIIRRIRPALIHSYSSYTNLAAWSAALGTKTQAIGAVRSGLLEAQKETGPLLAKLNGRWPRHQIFNNRAAAKLAMDSHRYFTPKHLFMVRNGIDLKRFPSVQPSSRKRAHVVGVGTLLPVKRWDRLLRAADILRQQGHDFLLRIVGDGPLRAFLLQEVNKLGLTACVEFPGYRDDIPAILADATFVVHTSDSEGCPNVIMEAMACGRAVVATDVGDTPDLIENKKTGFVVPRENEAMLVRRMATLIADRELCCLMGRAGRIKAEQEFSLDRLIAETFTLYKAAGLRAA